MNKSTSSMHPHPQRPCRWYRILPAVAVIALSGNFSASAEGESEDPWSTNMLLNPSPSVLRAESRGRVTIYDGLDNRVVEEALDSQFNRIQSMMFVNTRYHEPDGFITEDEDC